MAVTAKWYGQALMNFSLADWSTHDIKLMLCTSAYVPSQDDHVWKTDITSETSGTGYTAGGASLATTALSYSSGTNVIKLAADNVVWSTAAFSAYYGPIYDNTPAASSAKPLLAYVDFGQLETCSGPGTFTVQWSTQGALTVTAS